MCYFGDGTLADCQSRHLVMNATKVEFFEDSGSSQQNERMILASAGKKLIATDGRCDCQDGCWGVVSKWIRLQRRSVVSSGKVCL